MKKLLLILSGLMLLSGCAELRVIGNAAVTELNADAISVEMAAYEPKAAEPAGEPQPEKVYLAKADLNPFLKRPARLSSPQHGLWEGRE